MKVPLKRTCNIFKSKAPFFILCKSYFYNNSVISDEYFKFSIIYTASLISNLPWATHETFIYAEFIRYTVQIAKSLLDNCLLLFSHHRRHVCPYFAWLWICSSAGRKLEWMDNEYKHLRMLNNSYNCQSGVQIPTYKTSNIFRAWLRLFRPKWCHVRVKAWFMILAFEEIDIFRVSQMWPKNCFISLTLNSAVVTWLNET